MSDAQQIEEEKKFLKQYFEQICTLDVPTLKKYFLFVKQRKRGSENEKVPIKTFINTISEGNGKKAIHFGASRGDLEVFKYLIKKGADINLVDDKKNNPFLIAVQHNHIEIVRYLIDTYHIDVNYSRDTVTALHLASQQNSISMIELLLSAGANINSLSNFGTPVSFAVAYKANWGALHLIKKGADLNLVQKEMPSLLHLIIDQQNDELFDAIFNEFSDRIDVNIKDPTGWSALQLCAEKGLLKYASTLILHGADVDYENEGMSALDVAVKYEKWECVTCIRDVAQRKEAQIPKPAVEMSEEEIDQLFQSINTEKAKANGFLSQQQYAQAIEAYLPLIQKAQPALTKYGSEIVKIYTNLAQAQFKLNQFKETLATCKQARQVCKDWVKIYYYEGQAYEGLNELGEAAASYFEALKIKQDEGVKALFDSAMKRGKENYKK